VSTYQAISGAGGRALEEFESEIRSRVFGDGLTKRSIFPRSIAQNVIPQIPQADAYLSDGYTVEENKMMTETQKILGDPALKVVATCVRVPVRNSHSESVNLEFERPFPQERAVEALRGAPGVVLLEKPEDFPTPEEVSGKGEVFVGRLRVDPTVAHGLALWIVADNILKGAALNAIQIAELLASR
jgi:aspartate-semialdehyde dehydrogenase